MNIETLILFLAIEINNPTYIRVYPMNDRPGKIQSQNFEILAQFEVPKKCLKFIHCHFPTVLWIYPEVSSDRPFSTKYQKKTKTFGEQPQRAIQETFEHWDTHYIFGNWEQQPIRIYPMTDPLAKLKARNLKF